VSTNVLIYKAHAVALLLLLLLYYLPSFLAHMGFYLLYGGKPYREKPLSAAGYDCVRAFTC
jgi:hypothetical protein